MAYVILVLNFVVVRWRTPTRPIAVHAVSTLHLGIYFDAILLHIVYFAILTQRRGTHSNTWVVSPTWTGYHHSSEKSEWGAK